MNYFSFNGISNKSAGVVLLEPIGKLSPKQRGEFITVPGRDGQLFADEGAADVIEITLPIWVRPDADADYVRRWLRGAGRLKTEEGATGSYDAIVSDGYKMTALPMNSGFTANVPMTLQPYATQDAESKYTLSSSGLVTNPAPIDCYARVVLHGSGSGQVNIGGRVFSFDSFKDGTEVDGVNREAYYGTTICSGQMDGEWPYLAPGSNAVSFSGGVRSVEIFVQWPVL